MTKAVFTGSFDPFTMGHLDVLRRAAALFEVAVCVFASYTKQPAFTAEERCELIRRVVAAERLPNVSVHMFDGMAVEFARSVGASCIVRGIRAGDLAYELQMEALNRHLDPAIQTVYLAASPLYAHISSSAVKEVCAFGGKLEGLVPAPIQISIAERLMKR